MSDHDEQHDDDPNADPMIAAMHRALYDRFGEQLDEAKMAAVLAWICGACPDQELIARIRAEKPGLELLPNTQDGWIYVYARGLEPGRPTEAKFFGRFEPGMVLKPGPPRPQG